MEINLNIVIKKNPGNACLKINPRKSRKSEYSFQH
jgi:hypothetical protein